MACIRKRRNRWVVDFYDQCGKRRLKTLPKGATKRDARKVLSEIEEQVSRRSFLPGKKIPTFGEVARDWIEHKRPNLRPSTWDVYEGHIRNHFDELNNIKIAHITTATIEKWISIRQHRMHLLTLRKVLVTLGQIFQYAVRHKYIDYNPVREAERPRGTGGEHEKKIRILDPEQINRFLMKITEPKYRMLFTLAVFSGARQGELLGLKWSDIDWENSQIHIQRTFNKSRWYTTKTHSSNRRIDLGPSVMAELKRWKLACPKNDLDLVFPNRNGNPINYTNMMNRHFFPVLKVAGLPRMRFHDLRHTYASLLIGQGENIKYIQKQLGHASPTMTLNVYSHLMRDRNPEAAKRLEESVFLKNGD